MPSTNVAVTFSVQNAALIDLEAYRMTQVTSLTTLTTALTDTTGTTVVLANTALAVGSAFLVDNEPMQITATAGNGSYTVTRGAALSLYTTGVAATHAAAVQVKVLQFGNATALVKYILGLYLQGTIIPALGAASSVTGTQQASIATQQASIATVTAPLVLVT